jgi:hypothetical protein
MRDNNFALRESIRAVIKSELIRQWQLIPDRSGAYPVQAAHAKDLDLKPILDGIMAAISEHQQSTDP